MAKSTSKKVLKIIGLIVGVLLLIAVGVLLYVNHNAGKIADKLVRKEFLKSDLSKVYDLDFEDLNVNILSGSVKLINFKLSPKPGFYEASDSLRFANPILIDALIPKLIVKGLDIGSDLNLSDLYLKSVDIDRPRIKLIHHLAKAETEKIKKSIAHAVHDTTGRLSALEQLKVGEFNLNKGNFVYYNHLEKKTVFEAGEVNVGVARVVIHTGHIIETLLQEKFDEVSFQVKDVYYPLTNGFYDIRCAEVDLKLIENGINLSGVEVIPKYSKAEFGKAFGRQTDRFDIAVDKVELIDIGINSFLIDNKIEIATIVVSGADANLYRDKNIPFDTTRYPPLPNQLLGQVKQYIDVNKIEIKNSKLLYEELVPKSEVTGKVPITNMYGTIYNITNNPELIKKNGPMKWALQGELFDEALLTLEVDFPPDINSYSFKFHGNLEEMDMTAFNLFTRPNLHLEIKEGKINSMVYSADAGNDYSTGSMTMAYQGVKIEILKELTDEGEKKKSFLSSLANMVIRSNNPHKKSDGPAEPAEIFFVPDKHKAIFNYMVKSLINGIIGSLVPAAEQTLEKHEKGVEKQEKKDDRNLKKEERKQKRADRKADKK
jgi:hypothetical protein